MEKTLFTGSLVSFAEQHQTQEQRTFATMTFIFTDFRPNGNNQAVPKEERENLMTSALYKPVKIAYRGHAWAGHADAIPIGPITRVFDVEDALVAEAVIWKHEFPDVYELLSSVAQENPTAINFSWEMQYTHADVKDGVEWLRNCTVLAATIVENPAYQGRTHLIALSEQRSDAQSTESEAQPAQEEAAEAAETVAVRENDALQEQLRALQEELDQLRQFRASILQSHALAQRAESLAKAGASKLAEHVRHYQAKAANLTDPLLASIRWMSELSDDDFSSFLTLVALVAADKSVEAHASMSVVVPDVILASSSALPSPKEVAQLLREYRSYSTKR